VSATRVDELDLPSFEVMDDSLAGPRLHEVLRDLRERSWVARAEPVAFAVLDHEAVTFFLRTPGATFPGVLMLELQGVRDGPLHERLGRNLLALGGDDHRRLRRLVQPAFTPPAADRHRPAMRERLEALWARVAGAGRCDAVEAFAAPYPAEMIATVMGAPLADAPRLGAWANLIQGQFDPIRIARERPALERAALEFDEYTRALLHARRDDPREDLLTDLLRAEAEGDRLGEEECVRLVSAVLVGGVDTTQAQLAHALRLFCEHPDQWAMLGEDPGLAPAAVEEVLRYEPITPFTARIALEDLEHRGVAFPKGTVIAACQASANRDPAAWERPDALDIRAERGRGKPVTFGAGPHFCLGANLARAELQEALAFLAPRMRDMELDGEPEYHTPLGVYGMKRLPLRWRR
jgi:cytochrome P450